MSLVDYERRGRVAVLTVNNPPVNAMSPGVPRGICEGIAHASADGEVDAIVLAGAGRCFIAGADIRYFSLPWPENEENFSDVICALEETPKPVVAAIHGHALGGGLEVAMACHYRVLATRTSVGQPEVTLGFPPGAGGTQRLPRLAGTAAALDMIVSGSPVTAPRALELGIADSLIEDDLIEGACRFAAQRVACASSHRRTRDIAISLDDPGIFDAMRTKIARRARGMRAPYACIECVEAAVSLDFDAGIAEERRIFEACVHSDESKALRHVFFAERAAARIPGVSRETTLRAIASAGVVGAGTMGGGIAMNFANAGIPVTIVERDRPALERGMAVIKGNYAASVSRSRISQAVCDRAMALITPSVVIDDLGSADIIIEAVFEEMAVKKAVFAEIDRVARPGAIVTSNTSYLDIDDIAAAMPDRHGHVLGTHFFSPANVMRLVEVVRTANVSAETLATVLDLARRMGKFPVVAGVCHGFIGNRMLEGYFGEASLMVEEGIAPDRIDRVMFEFGMAMGPLAVMDLAGLDIGWSKRKDANGGTASDDRGAWIANRLCEQGRFGQKTGRGYYLYEEGSRTPLPDPGINDLMEAARRHFALPPADLADEQIVERCLYPLVNIGADILAEGHALRASDIDLVYINGYGFPAWRGGPMHWADSRGLDRILEDVCHRYGETGHSHWYPSSLLKQLALSGRTFADHDSA